MYSNTRWMSTTELKWITWNLTFRTRSGIWIVLNYNQHRKWLLPVKLTVPTTTIPNIPSPTIVSIKLKPASLFINFILFHPLTASYWIFITGNFFFLHWNLKDLILFRSLLVKNVFSVLCTNFCDCWELTWARESEWESTARKSPTPVRWIIGGCVSKEHYEWPNILHHHS